jgi:hypothetical protein
MQNPKIKIKKIEVKFYQTRQHNIPKYGGIPIRIAWFSVWFKFKKFPRNVGKINP